MLPDLTESQYLFCPICGLNNATETTDGPNSEIYINSKTMPAFSAKPTWKKHTWIAALQTIPDANSLLRKLLQTKWLLKKWSNYFLFYVWLTSPEHCLCFQSFLE